MADDLNRLMDAIEGEGPSPEFVVALRERIVAESTTPAPTLEEPVFDLDLRSASHEQAPSSTPSRWMFVGLAAAAVALIVGFIALLDDGDDGELETINDPQPSSTTVSTTTTIEAPGPDESGSPLTAGNTFFDAGTFRIDTLGTAFTFTVAETRGLLLNENDIVLITDLTSRNTDDRTITFRRTSLLPDPAAPTAEFDPSSGWPATDLVGWLELVSDDIAATTPTSSTLGGLDATFVELEFPCTGENCVAAFPIQTPEFPMFTPGSRYRLWVVDQGEEDPILVVVAIDDEDEAAWFDEADGMLATLEFESIEPNPVRRIPAGSIELDAFDGISLELPEEVVVVEPFDGFARIFPPGFGVDGPQRPGLGWGGDVEFLTRPRDTDGVEVTTVERLMELLEDEAAVLTELDAFDVGGFEARAFDVNSGSYPNVVLKARSADLIQSEFGWESPRDGRLWVVEHPERGLLFVSAEAWYGPGDVEPLRPWTEDLLGSLEFREP